MTASIRVWCPDGCVEWEISGHHEGRPDHAHVLDAVPGEIFTARGRLCPECGRLMECETDPEEVKREALP